MIQVSGTTTFQHCRWCGMMHGPMCNAVKAIEFHADGVTVKRVEFKGAADYPANISSGLAINPNQCTTGG